MMAIYLVNLNMIMRITMTNNYIININPILTAPKWRQKSKSIITCKSACKIFTNEKYQHPLKVSCSVGFGKLFQ